MTEESKLETRPYALRLAEHGLLTLAYDASYPGESGGEPRRIEVPAQGLDDISGAMLLELSWQEWLCFVRRWTLSRGEYA